VKRTELEDALAFQIRTAGLPEPEREHRFKAPGKRNPYRFDFAWPERMLAVEVQGGIWIRGGHSRGAGQQRDMTKMNEAQIAGWRVLAVSGNQIKSGEALSWIERAFAEKAA